MGTAAIEPTEEALLSALDAARQDHIKILAIVWTWLEPQLRDLGDLRMKPHAIRKHARRLPGFAVWTEHERRQLTEEDVLIGAAKLLVRIHRPLEHAQMPTFALPTEGFDGQPVVVVWKTPALATWTIDADAGDEEKRYGSGPPTQREQPSMAALAPRLAVCPREVDGIELEVLDSQRQSEQWREAWRAACDQLEQGLAAAAGNASERGSLAEAGRMLSVHLDALGSAGLSGWRVDPDPALCVGRFDEDNVEALDEERCCADAERAVLAASGQPGVLVMPELVATSRVERKIAQTLRFKDKAPAFTVVGLYHREVPAAERAADAASGRQLAPYVNEAVVLAPDGSELWRHRKLTYAMDGPPPGAEPGDPGPAEDIRPGRRLTIAPSPLGMVAVIVCLDSIQDESRQRVAQSSADVLLIPSLSPHVKRHRTSLQQLVQALWGVAFVCNRPFTDSNHGDREGDGHRANADDSGSFWTLQRHGACVAPPCPESPSCVVFRLDRPCAEQPVFKSDSSMLDDEGGGTVK